MHRIGVIARGKLLAVGTVEELRDKVREKVGIRYALEVQDLPVQRVMESLRGLKGVRSVEAVNGHISLLTDMGTRMEIAKHNCFLNLLIIRYGYAHGNSHGSKVHGQNHIQI